jgi:hypothetical protein
MSRQSNLPNGFDDLNKHSNPASRTPLGITAAFASRSTTTALPVSHLAQMVGQALQAGKRLLELGDIIISRDLDGNWVIQSTEISGLATNTAIKKSGEARTVSSTTQFSYAFLLSLLGTLVYVNDWVIS